MSTTPIADYALLSDRHSAALVSRDGSIDWLCFPRFDSPSIFARLLGDEAGHWSIRAAGATQVTRRYLDRTMVLETTFHTPTGSVAIIDALAMGDGNRGHDLGRDAPHLLLRQATCIEGEVDLRPGVRPASRVRPGPSAARPGRRGAGRVRWRRRADALVVRWPSTVEQSSASGELHLREGESAGFALHHAQAGRDRPARVWSQAEISARLDDTVAAWESWSDLHQAYVGPWRDLVHHSGRVLQALSFQPTGAICAAATTSLPEVVGGARNWDYRYAWVRDASFTIEALWVAACPDEANEFFDYVTTSAAGSLERGGDLQIMFGIGGERDLTERELPHLEGWRHSAPVRVGNGAWSQRQLDVYGELLSAVYRLSDHLFDDASTSRADGRPRQVGCAARAGPGHATVPRRSWPTPRPGVGRRRTTESGRSGASPETSCTPNSCAGWRSTGRWPWPIVSRRPNGSRHWKQTQAQIREAILTKGWSDRANAFTQSFGSDDLDASSLMLPLVGFLPADDPRVLSTIDATEERLTDERGLVYRYRAHDGLDGDEGTFLLCTFWLAQALAEQDSPRGLAPSSNVPRLRQRCRPARRGGRSDQRRAAGQLSAGLQSHRTGQRGLGHIPEREPK